MIEVLKQMVEALEYHIEQTRPISKTKEAIQVGKQAIAELESQEPVVEMEALADNDSAYAYADGWNACVRKFKATHPPQRTWAGLTDDEFDELDKEDLSLRKFVQAIDDRLKQKNGYTEEKNT